MSEAVEIGSMIERAREEAGLRQMDLWIAYQAGGGSREFSQFTMYLRGQADMHVSEYNVVARLLNAALPARSSNQLPVVE